MKAAAHFKFRLYIAGDGPNSAQAVANLNALCQEHFLGGYETEIVDVLLTPQRALADGVLLTPTLIKLAPAPVRKIVGTLAHRPPLLAALGLSPEPG